jgi:Raf kinase inhibitor-like YbhB/YbcL family protein
MKLWSNSLQDGGVVPGEFAFCVIDPATHVKFSQNRNPHLAWSDAPEETKSFALIVHDPDVPSRGDDVNQEGKTVSITLPRVDFIHWVMIDLPTHMKEIGEGQFSESVTPHGKRGPAVEGLHGARQGLNDYTGWFADDGDMAGDYFGYDGPCPPWNDSIPHHYVFTLYALDIERVQVEGSFTAQQVKDAIFNHVLAQASITARYTLNPKVTP